LAKLAIICIGVFDLVVNQYKTRFQRVDKVVVNDLPGQLIKAEFQDWEKPYSGITGS
jgi:hypothetical protein